MQLPVAPFFFSRFPQNPISFKARRLVFAGLTLLSLAMIGISCSAQKRSSAEQPAFDRLILRQGACFGTCPVFDMTIEASGEASYDGRNFSNWPGLHEAKLDSDTMRMLQMQVEAVLAKADQIPSEIPTQIADLAYSTIVIMKPNGDSLRFMGNYGFPEPLDQLRGSLLRIGAQTEWKASANAEALPPRYLLIELQSSDQIQPVTEAYFKQQMKMVRLLPNTEASFIVRFDPFAMSAEEIKDDMKRNKLVKSVEILQNDDQRIEPRR